MCWFGSRSNAVMSLSSWMDGDETNGKQGRQLRETAQASKQVGGRVEWLQTEASSNLGSKKFFLKPTSSSSIYPSLFPSSPILHTCVAALPPCSCAFFVTAYRTDRTSPPPSLAFFTTVLRRSGYRPVPRSSRLVLVCYCILGDGLL